MNWLKRKLRNWLMQEEKLSFKASVVARDDNFNELSSNKSLNFKVYPASGGRVIETRRYDEHKDRTHYGLYIITNDQDLGPEIDKIITMESLK